MAEAILFNAARTQAIEDNAINSGFVDANGKLILVKHNGVQVDAGNVVGPQGPSSRYALPAIGGASSYFRIATIDGLNASNGGHFNFFVSGYGDFGNPNRATILVHAGQRDTDVFTVRAWAWNLENTQKVSEDILFYRKTGPFLFEIWMRTPNFQKDWALTILSESRNTLNIDDMSTATPSNLVIVPIQNSDYSPKAVVSDRTDSLSDTTVIKGLLPATYRGTGPTKVKINGTLSSNAYSWMTPYDPMGSREVRLIKTASGYMISGQINDGVVYPPLNLTNWRTYGERGAASWSSPFRAVKLPSGLVVLDGMLGGVVAPADNSLIATLPPGYRPDNDMLVAVEHGDTSRNIRIFAATGEIKVYGSSWPASWLTLSGISFWAAGVAQWTDVGSGGSSFASAAKSDSGWNAQYGVPGFWKDPYGFVWFRGLVQLATGVSADNTPLITLPTTHRPSAGEHHRTTGNNGYAGIGAGINNGLNWKPNSPGTAGSWISLASVIVKTADADAGGSAGNIWSSSVTLLNNWAANGGGNQTPNYLLREDGLRMTVGIVNGGTLPGSILMFTDPEFRVNRARMTIPLMSNNARGRLSLTPNWYDGDVYRGAFYVENGSNAWVSMDSRVWIP